MSLCLPTASGDLHITLMGHGSLMIEYGARIIHVDPYSEKADYTLVPPADQIWITHEHFDHLDPAAIDAIRKDGTLFVANPGAAVKLDRSVKVLRNGETARLDGIDIAAVPAYNVVRERSPGIKFHPPGHGNGYVASFGGLRVYIAGDTEATPEMLQLSDIDVAFVPLMAPYTMTPAEAAAALRVFRPKIAVPYHTDRPSAEELARLLSESPVEVRIIN